MTKDNIFLVKISLEKLLRDLVQLAVVREFESTDDEKL